MTETTAQPGVYPLRFPRDSATEAHISAYVSGPTRPRTSSGPYPQQFCPSAAWAGSVPGIPSHHNAMSIGPRFLYWAEAAAPCSPLHVSGFLLDQTLNMCSPPNLHWLTVQVQYCSAPLVGLIVLPSPLSRSARSAPSETHPPPCETER